MNLLAGAAVGLALGGPWGALLIILASLGRRYRPSRGHPLQIRPVLLLLMVELRSGMSVLGALQSVSERFPEHRQLATAVRVGTVSGLVRAADVADPSIRPLVTQLARAQITGSSSAEAVRRLLESELAQERSDRLARARSLPVRLMIPVTLLVLPGVVLSTYGPSLIALLDDLAVPFT